MWAFTCVLLALVAGIFTLGGTAGESGGLFGCAAIAGFLMLAGVIGFIRRAHKPPR